MVLRADDMKIKFEVVIDANREAVWSAFHNPADIFKWQPTLKSLTHKSGNPGDIGAVSELIYAGGIGKRVVSETITENRRPHFMSGIYEARWSKSLVVNYFENIGGNRTRWVAHANHHFGGIMKLVTPVLRRVISMRAENDMGRFKLMVESQVASEES